MAGIKLRDRRGLVTLVPDLEELAFRARATMSRSSTQASAWTSALNRNTSRGTPSASSRYTAFSPAVTGRGEAEPPPAGRAP